MEGRGGRVRMEFDPLAFLEAEYAAVLAQTRPKSPAAEDERCESDNNAQNDHKSAANDDDDDDDDDDDASDSGAPDECYALLPSSPHASDDEEEEDTALDHHDKTELLEDDAAAASAPAAVMDAAKRETIMQSMRQFSLPPPSWAKKANLSDDELVDLVQKQLGTAVKQQRAA